MRNHRQLRVIAIMMVLLVGSLQLVLADGVPPLESPGSSIGSGGLDTQVQMVSEEVLITVIEAEGIDTNRAGFAELFQGRSIKTQNEKMTPKRAVTMSVLDSLT